MAPFTQQASQEVETIDLTGEGDEIEGSIYGVQESLEVQEIRRYAVCRIRESTANRTSY